MKVGSHTKSACGTASIRLRENRCSLHVSLIACASLLAFGGLVGCPGNTADACASDGDCAAKEICIDGACVEGEGEGEGEDAGEDEDAAREHQAAQRSLSN